MMNAATTINGLRNPRLGETDVNRSRRQQAEAALADILSASLTRGFYGTCAVELAINDGTIQNISRRLEQTQRM